jgi:hypothetical protein
MIAISLLLKAARSTGHPKLQAAGRCAADTVSQIQ